MDPLLYYLPVYDLIAYVVFTVYVFLRLIVCLQVGTVTLLLLVPDSADNLDELLVKLPAVSLQQLVQEWLPHSEVSVSLPQLTVISSATDITPFLRLLGIRSVFNATSGDLSAATVAPGVHVKSVTQDAFFSVSFTSVNSVGSVATKLGKDRPVGGQTATSRL